MVVVLVPFTSAFLSSIKRKQSSRRDRDGSAAEEPGRAVKLDRYHVKCPSGGEVNSVMMFHLLSRKRGYVAVGHTPSFFGVGPAACAGWVFTAPAGGSSAVFSAAHTAQTSCGTVIMRDPRPSRGGPPPAVAHIPVDGPRGGPGAFRSHALVPAPPPGPVQRRPTKRRTVAKYPRGGARSGDAVPVPLRLRVRPRGAECGWGWCGAGWGGRRCGWCRRPGRSGRSIPGGAAAASSIRRPAGRSSGSRCVRRRGGGAGPGRACRPACPPRR